MTSLTAKETAPTEVDGRLNRFALPVVVLLCMVCYAMYFVHLRADFPNGSPWNDWAKFTDEGWYGGAALRYFQTGHWYAAGSFNPAVGLPVWPLLLGAWFRLTGPGMAAARTLSVLLFGGSLLLLFHLLRPMCGRLAAAVAVLLLLVNPFCYAFYRLAILEPLAVFLFLLGLWIGTGARVAEGNLFSAREESRALLVGCVLGLLVLTKTTAIVLAPALLYPLWFSCAEGPARRSSAWQQSCKPPSLTQQRARALLPPCMALLACVLLWAGYFTILVRPHYFPDFQQIFRINRGHAHGRILLRVMARALGGGLWIDPVLFPMAILIFAASLRFLRELWRTPIFVSAVLALACSIGFIGWHTWFQPRYYLVCAMPMMIVLSLGFHALWAVGDETSARVSRTVDTKARLRLRPVKLVALSAVLVAALLMAVRTARFVLHPEYTFLGAAQAIAATIRGDATHSQVLLAGSAEDIALFTGLTPANPEYATASTADLLHEQHPGWYAAYPPWEDAHIANMQKFYTLRETGRYRVFDDPDHEALVLYRLDPR